MPAVVNELANQSGQGAQPNERRHDAPEDEALVLEPPQLQPAGMGGDIARERGFGRHQ